MSDGFLREGKEGGAVWRTELRDAAKKQGKPDKLDLAKIKTFFSAKDLVMNTELQTTSWENIFVKHITHKGLGSGLHA